MLQYAAIATGFVLATVVLRGQFINDWGYLNPDEAELLVQARAALHSPVPFSTWTTGTTGPYWTLFLAGLGVLGAPLTLAFAHLVAAALLGLTAATLLVAASGAVGFRPACALVAVWWLPFTASFPIGKSEDFGALSTELLPGLLLVISALVPRDQLAARPWLFAVLGALTGLAVGSKFQAAPLAVSFAAAQLFLVHTRTRRTVASLLWWLAGAVLPVAAIVATIVVSAATNWVLIDQTISFLGSYAGGPTTMEKLTRTWTGLSEPGLYVLSLVVLLVWLGLHSDRRSNMARVAILGGGVVSVLIGGMGFPHYFILLFAGIGLAMTMPVKPDVSLLPERVSPVVVATVMAIAAIAVLDDGYQRNLWRPSSPRQAFAAFSSNSVNRNRSMASYCPAKSVALVWGWGPEIYIAQDWQSSIPYPNVLGMAISPEIRDSAEPVIRNGIERARCVVDATNMARPQCSVVRTEHPLNYCLPPSVMLSRIYPQLFESMSRQFHAVAIVDGCSGCSLYVRVPSS